ncbi:hypothetical protein BZA70DRAFT_58179 [Myxozyma melibiosi]|uniref:F-box domain-containing protein n=1 Tax=Myxozyma melibiosi TaxID=54550 RepID=A0ABR1F1P8_9ASCO
MDCETATKDPIIALPFDIITDIFFRIPYGERLILRRVSKSWNRELLSNCILWQHIDFLSGKRPVRLADVERSIAFADGVIQELYLEKLFRPEESLCVDALMEASDRNPGALRRLELNCYAPHFWTMDPHGSSSMGGKVRIDTFCNLTSLKIALDQADYFLRESLGQVTFSNLQELFIYADRYRHYNRRGWIRAPTGLDGVPFPNLKLFKLGSQLAEEALQEWELSYIGPVRYLKILMDQRLLHVLIAMMPNLEHLEIIRVAAGDSSGRAVKAVPMYLSRHSRLTYLNLTQSSLDRNPLLPKNCKTLILDSSDVPTFATIFDRSHLDYDREAFEKQSGSIEKYDISRQESLSNYEVMHQLSLLNPEAVTDLSLRLVCRHFWPDDRRRMSGIARTLSRGVTVPDMSPIDYMLQQLPNIERLNVSCTRVTDLAMDKISRFQRLEYLDVSGTAVTLQGVLYLLNPEVNGSKVNNSQTWRWSDEPWRSTTNLKTIILKKCRHIDESTMEWLEDHGITTGLRLSDDPEWVHLKNWDFKDMNHFR